MAKPFDATLKHLVESHPADWLALAGLPCSGPVEILDADLSFASAAADKIIRVSAPFPYIAHLEFQSSADMDLDERVLFYKVLIRYRNRLPVISVVFLLRPQAEGNASGKIVEAITADQHLEFRYKVIRIWQQPAATLLKGGLGTLPLAPISDLGAMPLEQVCLDLAERVDREEPRQLKDVVTATMILLGLNYPRAMVQKLFRKVRNMRESSVYQAIIEEGVEEGRTKGRAEGRSEGRVEEARSLLLRLGEKRLGALSPEAEASFRSITDIAVLESLIERTLEASSWQDLLPPKN